MSGADFATALGQELDPMRLMQRATDRTLGLIPGAEGVMVGLGSGTKRNYVPSAGSVSATPKVSISAGPLPSTRWPASKSPNNSHR